MEQKAKKTLADLRVTTVRNIRQPVGSLSGGQRQSVAVAKAVMLDAKLVVMDEPTAALGVKQTALILDLIERLSARGIAVLVISHNLTDVFQVADRIAVLYLGRLVVKRPEVRLHDGLRGPLDHHRHRPAAKGSAARDHGGLTVTSVNQEPAKPKPTRGDHLARRVGRPAGQLVRRLPADRLPAHQLGRERRAPGHRRPDHHRRSSSRPRTRSSCRRATWSTCWRSRRSSSPLAWPRSSCCCWATSTWRPASPRPAAPSSACGCWPWATRCGRRCWPRWPRPRPTGRCRASSSPNWACRPSW